MPMWSDSRPAGEPTSSGPSLTVGTINDCLLPCHDQSSRFDAVAALLSFSRLLLVLEDVAAR
jgi:hypothetical protein